MHLTFNGLRLDTNMKIYYSKSARGFFMEGINPEEQMPSDCVVITEQRHEELMQAQASGLEIVGDADGNPTTIDPTTIPMTPEQARAKRESLLIESDWTQMPDAPVDKASWATYRQALRDITKQSGFPHDVVWPTKP